MRKTLFLAGLAAVALTTSCSEDFDLLGNKHEVTLGARVTAEGTRAAFTIDENTAKFYWTTGDEIGVTSINNNSQTGFSKFTLSSGAGDASATFKGNVVGEVNSTCYAVYPYYGQNVHSIDGTTLTYQFPASYNYESVGTEAFPGTKDCNSFNPAMWAQVGDNNSVAFKHLGGIFLVRVESMPCTEGKLVFSATEKMAGKSVVNLSETGTTPECKNGTALTDGSSEVTITFSNAQKDKYGVFYIPVPTGVYTNIGIKIYDNSNSETAVYEVSAGSFNITRKLLQPLPLTGQIISGTESATASTAAEVQSKLAENENVNSVAVAAVEAAEGATAANPTVAAITIPAVSSSTTESDVAENTQKAVTVEKISENVKITLTDAKTTTETETTEKKSVESVVLSIPNIPIIDGKTESLPAVDVAMPNTTVTLAGNAGTANYGEVTAATADNTLVVSGGVTIQELVVKKGNVRIDKGATVKSIVLDNNYSGKCEIYYEEGASYPSGLETSKFELIHMAYIESELDFAEAMSKGGTVDFTLTKDVTLSQSYTTAKTVSIDLNGKTLTTTGLIQAVGGSLTLKNGNIIQNGKNDKNSGINVGTNGKLTVDKVNYTGQYGYDCFYVIKCSQKATLSISNSKIKSKYYGVTTNASTDPEVAKECVITLDNCVFEADESGALINIPATVTMKDCTFSGDHQGAFLRGGDYTISGCTFKLNATKTASDSENMWMKTWKNGNQGAFAALTIGNYINTAYQYETKITFAKSGDKGNTVEVSGDNATSFPAIHVCANADTQYPVTITGMSNVTVPTTGCKTPAIEYGTANITVDGKDPASYISDESGFIKAMSEGGIYVLKNNVTLSAKDDTYTGFATGEGKTVVIDLNKKTLTAPSRVYARNNGSLTLNNGNIKQSNGKNLRAGDHGTLTLDHVVYTGEANTNCNIFIEKQITNATINVLNSTINGGYYAVGTNATQNEVSSNCVLNLENSKFIANETGALINILAKVTLKNCTFSGNHQGALIRGGAYTISGCTFTLNATLPANNTDNHWMTAWGVGNQGAFAALTIGNYGNDSYKYPTTATFTGTNKAEVKGTYASSFPAIHVCAKSAEYPVTITGFASHMTTSGGKTPAIEYGTDNITVDSKAATKNVSTK